MKNKSKTAKKLTGSIGLIVLLALCLGLTTLALVYTGVTVEENLFTTGRVSIELKGPNGENVVYPEENPLQIEPGETERNAFCLENTGTVSAYYRLYFSFSFETTEDGELTERGRAQQTLAGNLQVKIYKRGESEPLYNGPMIELVKGSDEVEDTVGVLGKEETQWFDIYVTLPEGIKNDAADSDLSFDICADAVQAENNDGRLFN